MDKKTGAKMTMTVKEAGKLLGLGSWAVYKAVREGTLPSLRFGKLIKIPSAAVWRMPQIEQGEVK